MEIMVPEKVRSIIDRLNSRGYDAYAVGGCIRDSLMGIPPHDWDICTSALPEEVLNVLEKNNVIESGLKHGTVSVNVEGELFEITTFRTDGAYLDNRHPADVKFVRSLREDLQRRDFTMNAIAYHHKTGLQDEFGGCEDIRRGIIRCVGDPEKRFGEDALRILRALRFASRLGFEIEEKTSRAIHRRCRTLEYISAERISAELVQILMGQYAESVLLEYSDVITAVIPDFKRTIGCVQHNPHHIYDVWVHTVKTVSFSPADKILRLAAFFHDIAKPLCKTTDEKGIDHFHGHPLRSAEMCRSILGKLRFDKKTISEVCLLIEHHDYRPSVTPKSVRKFISKVGVNHYEKLMELKRADARAQCPEFLPAKLQYLDELAALCQKETANGQTYRTDSLAVNGTDLMKIGIEKGKIIGDTLHYLLSELIAGEIMNDYDSMIKAAARYNHIKMDE